MQCLCYWEVLTLSISLLLLFTVCRAVLLPPISSHPTNIMDVCSVAKPVLQVLAVIYASPLTSFWTASVWPRVQLASPLTQSLGTVLLVLTLTVHPVLRARKSANNATQLSDRYSSLILVLTAHNLVLQLKLNVFDAFRQVALSAVTGTVRRSVGGYLFTTVH